VTSHNATDTLLAHSRRTTQLGEGIAGPGVDGGLSRRGETLPGVAVGSASAEATRGLLSVGTSNGAHGPDVRGPTERPAPSGGIREGSWLRGSPHSHKILQYPQRSQNTAPRAKGC
jgi:hypothetical protein